MNSMFNDLTASLIFSTVLVTAVLVSVLLLAWGAFLLRLVIWKRRVPSCLMSATPFVLLLAFAIYLWPVRPWMLRAKQVRSFSNMALAAHYLHKYKTLSGNYPTDLSTALPEKARSILVDAWGYPLRYYSTGSAFILVSVGKDGKPDFADYWALRSAVQPRSIVSGSWSADQVVSDLGWHRSAGK